MKERYEWQVQHKKNQPDKKIEDWKPPFGARILERKNDSENNLVVEINILVHNDEELYLVGNFNNWGENLDGYRLKPDEYKNIYSIKTVMRHKTTYKIYSKTRNKYFQDPAGFYFDNEGNTIFWDFNHKDSYKQKKGFVDTRNKSLKIIQTDLPGLIAHYSDGEKLGSDVEPKEYYKFIARSGVVKELKKLGFNAIQFLPFAQSIDGDNWKYRYLVPFQYAIQKNWGDPDDFKEMIDAFHEEDIAVIGDFVLGHVPHKDYKIFGLDSDYNGLHVWEKKQGYTYLKDDTHWGTKRLDFDNPLVRKFFINSCVSFQKHYRIDGFRIDNVDGIIRYGEHGGGDERPHGRTFLRELNSEIYSYNPHSIINYEAHYFFEDNAKLLVAPLESDKRALGATAYNESRLTYYLHRYYMLKAADEISAWKPKHIIEEKEWGASNSTIADFHNHDAAAGLMEQRATGSYAYDTMTVKQPENHIHAIGKIKVMEALISFLGEGRTLDLLQSFLLQTGTFEHDSSIRWYLSFKQVSKNMLGYKKRINDLMDESPFWPENVSRREVLNVDDTNKVLVVSRSDGVNSYLIVINLAVWRLFNYKVGVKTKNEYGLVFSSDSFEYSGFGLSSQPTIFKNKPSNNFEVLDRELEVPSLSPYEVLVLKEN